MNRNDEVEGTNGVDRRTFIAQTLAAGASVGAMAAWPESADAQRSLQNPSRGGKDVAVGDGKLPASSNCLHLCGTKNFDFKTAPSLLDCVDHFAPG